MQRTLSTRTLLNRYGALFRMPLLENLAEVGNVVSAVLVMTMFMWVFAMLWQAVFAAQGTDLIAGLTLKHTLWYLLMAELVVLSKPLLAEEISDSIKTGSIAYDLMRPLDFGLFHLSRYAGHVAFRACVNLLAGGIVVWLLVGPPPAWQGLFPAVLALMLSWGLEFCFEALIGLAAFWTEDISAFRWIHQKISFILGGLFLPLDFYPPWLAAVARVLPFASIIYAPGRLFVDPDAGRLLSTLALQLGWLVVLGFAFRLLSSRTLRRLTINGG
ncbi:MAG: hypothetical protein F4Y37_04035 [Caldilineaceae bacterium SB0664_bin_22]|nr:hypothetical protein [Caldilineaceae bacterium SB0664_bin_22]